MRFQVRGINHLALQRVVPAHKRSGHPIEYSHAAPANEAMMERLVRPIILRCIAPAKTVTD